MLEVREENVEIFKEAGGIEAMDKYREDCDDHGYGAGIELAERVKNLYVSSEARA